MSKIVSKIRDADNLIDRYVNILRSSVTPEILKDPDRPISSLIYYNDLNSVKQRISDWVASRLTARRTFVPDWTDLIRVYDYVMIDSHVSGIINGIKQKIKAKEYIIVSSDTEMDEVLTKELHTRWFSRYVDFFVESFFYPYSLIELGEYRDGKFNDITMIKREYVVPQYKSVKSFLYGSTVPKYVIHQPQTGVKVDEIIDPESYLLMYFEGEDRVNDYIFMQCPLHDLGLLDKAAPHALGKMGSYTFYLDYLQKFVIPFRHGKTEINDPDRRNNMDAMMAAWGGSGYAVTDIKDEIYLLEQSGTATAPFTELFKYSNNEISKAFASAVGIFDEKNFVGSAEAGERMLDALVQAYCAELEYNVNDELIPRMAIRDSRYQGKSFEIVQKEPMTYKDRVDAVVKLAPHFELDADEVSEKIDFKIEHKESEPMQSPFVQEKDEFEPMPKEMVENAKRALKWVELKNIKVDSIRVRTLNSIIVKEELQSINADDIKMISKLKEVNKPYAVSGMSVIADLCGGKEGKEWAKRQLENG